MNGPGAAREPMARATRLIGKHKVISSVIALFAAAVIVVSVATSGSAAPQNHPAAAGFTLTAVDEFYDAGPKPFVALSLGTAVRA